MATGWAGVVIRCEQIEGSTATKDGEPVLLVRVQLALGDAPPEVIGPRVARRSDAGELVAAVLDKVFETLATVPEREVDDS